MVAGFHFLLLDAAGAEFGIVMKLLEHGAGDAEVGIDTDKVHQFKRSHFESAAFKEAVDGFEGGGIFFEGFETLHVIVSGHAIHDKPGGIGGVDGGFAERLRPVERFLGDFWCGGNAFDDFNELHDVGWVEEVHAYYTLGVLEGGGDLGDGDARGIGGEDGIWGVDGFQEAKEFAFDWQLFKYCFDDEIGDQGIAVGGGAEERQCRCGFFRGGFAFAHGHIELCLDVCVAFFEGCGVYIEQNGRVSSLDATQGDA